MFIDFSIYSFVFLCVCFFFFFFLFFFIRISLNSFSRNLLFGILEPKYASFSVHMYNIKYVTVVSFRSCFSFEGNPQLLLQQFTFGMDFYWRREYPNFHHLFDTFRIQNHFDFANHSNGNLITLVVLDSMVHRAVPNGRFLRQPGNSN